jgi:predicted murein hydrolase (TIGR00659 family)
MNPRIGEIWVYLAASPLLGLTLTLLAYQGAVMVSKRCDNHPLANPVLLAVSALVTLLWITGTPYGHYFDGAQFVHFLLGPATVALAIPLHAQFARLKRMALPVLAALLAGSLTASISGVVIGSLLRASDGTLLSLAPKSVTTPIAMGITERIGGLPSLTAALVILTGIIGAVCASGIYAVLKIEDRSVQGFAVGIASHGIGTARAFQVSE